MIMFWNRKVLYRGSSIKRYHEIINILELNNIKYTHKIENKNKDKESIIDTMIIGTLSQSEDFSYEYSIFVNKKNYESANYLINHIN